MLWCACKITGPSVTWARTVPIPASPCQFFRSMFDSNRRQWWRYYRIDCQDDRVPSLCICNFPLGYSPGTLYPKFSRQDDEHGRSHELALLCRCRALRSNLIAANADLSIRQLSRVLAKMLNAVSSSMACLVAHHCGTADVSFIITKIENTQGRRIEVARATSMNCSPGINARNF
jgi:hypothetical protein